MSKVVEMRVMEEVMDVSKKGSRHVFFVQVREAVALSTYDMGSRACRPFENIVVSRRGSTLSEWTLKPNSLTLLDVVCRFQPE